MKISVSNALKNTRVILYPTKGRPVDQTVAESMVSELAPSAKVFSVQRIRAKLGDGTLTVSIADEYLPHSVSRRAPNRSTGKWMTFRIAESGNGELVASHSHLLYALFCLIKGDWADQDVAGFTKGRTVKPTFVWLRNLNDFFVGSLRKARHFDREEFVKQLARQGFSHITINGLGVDRPFESGPPGDVYSWFYDYSPDLDQFVDSELLRGYYPSDYLEANLTFLKRNSALVTKYGLTPGLHINSPRSMPEEFW
ncbi:MAG: hypothetical protein AABZ61_03675, partial [Bacteroidota bacterium]